MSSETFTYVETAFARVKVSERTKYYNVTGKTGRQLYSSMKRRGPKSGSRHDLLASTDWEVDIQNVQIAVRGNRCVVTKGDVVVKITYTYPRWRNRRRASRQVQRNWQKFMAELKKHERHHAHIVRAYAKKLHRNLRRATGRISKNCEDVASTPPAV